MQLVSDDDVRKKDFLKSHVVLSWRRKVYSDWEDVTSSGRAFQVFGPTTGTAQLTRFCIINSFAFILCVTVG